MNKRMMLRFDLKWKKREKSYSAGKHQDLGKKL